VNEKLGLLILGNATSVINCLLLRIVNGSRSLVASTLYGPAVRVRYHMLVLPRHNASFRYRRQDRLTVEIYINSFLIVNRHNSVYKKWNWFSGKNMTASKTDILELIDAALAADYTRVRRVGGKIAQSLAKEDVEAAKEIRALIRKRGVPLKASGYSEVLPVDAKSRLPLMEEQSMPSTPVFLNQENSGTYASFVEDVRNVDMLASKGLSSRLSMLISGPPGTGKTLLAGHIASQLGRPLYVVRLDAVVSSLLGDTSKNIRQVFEYAPTRNAVLFLDEMDAVAKVRDDQHELGELKRVVNTVIQALDAIDDHAVVIGATNHPQLLDPAIWRRFPYKMDLGLPDEDLRKELWKYFLDEADDFLGNGLSQISTGLSGADIQNLAHAARRISVLDGRPVNFANLAWAALQNKKGVRALPDRTDITTDQRRELALALAKDNFSGADAARILGVSRQAVSGYLRGE